MRRCGLVLVAALVAARVAHAQSETPEGLSLQVMGGAVRPFQTLNSAGTDSLRGGPYASGTLNWQPSNVPELSVRGGVAWSRQELRTARAGSGTRVNLFLLGFDVGYTYLHTRRWSSTVFGGGGAVLIHEGATGASKVKPFSRLGLDANFRIASSLELFVQGNAVIFEISNFPTSSVLGRYRHRQGDGVVGGGVAVRF